MGLGALSFAAPGVLLALIALPAIWWLLRATPPAPRRRRFPAFEILRGARREEETPAHTPWWLVALRLALAAFVIFALAGPALDAPASTGRTGPLVMVVDDAWPAAPTWEDRRDALAAAAGEAQRDGRAFYLLTTSPDAAASLSPLAPADARGQIEALEPTAYAPDWTGAAKTFDLLADRLDGRPEIRWLFDGAIVGDADAAAFARRLSARGDLTVYRETDPAARALRPIETNADGLALTALRPAPGPTEALTATVTARDGRPLGATEIAFADGETSAHGEIALPLALRNEASVARIVERPSTGGVQLADARSRRALVGLYDGDKQASGGLLSGLYYIRQAMAPYAEFLEGDLKTLAASDANVIVLDDIGRLRPSEEKALKAWTESGGVLLRFAGPRLVEATREAETGGEPPALLPVPLRENRALGGALTWEKPQPLAPFPDDSPFADLSAPKETAVRSQVLARPGLDVASRTWATLADGTPLVTAAPLGGGVIVLFHVTADPSWSDLPLSGVFPQMLRRIAFASARTTAPGAEDTARYLPISVLNGLGQLVAPPADARPVSALDAEKGPAPGRPPGLYGAPEAPIAVNAVGADTKFESWRPGPGVSVRAYDDVKPRRLADPLFLIALLMLLADGLATLALAGKLRFPGRRAAAAAVLALLAAPVAFPHEAHAQLFNDPAQEKAAEAALHTRFAYVRTGNAAIDDISRAGLEGLDFQLRRRTAVEPAPPAAVDLDRDDLSVYPMVYWPIDPDAPPPSEAALAKVDAFMASGGLVIFDTRDADRAATGVQTPEGAALREILSKLNTPPLEPLPQDNVLMRSFFLLDDLPGRFADGAIWVEAGGGGSNDGVTPLIIGGRDWASAWARDEYGRPLRPMSPGGERQREYAYRAGMNMAMVAFTGSYKTDQVHAATLLDRLGR